jgi:hypothetical protein
MSRRTLKIVVVATAVVLSGGIGIATATSGSAAVGPDIYQPVNGPTRTTPTRTTAPTRPAPSLPPTPAGSPTSTAVVTPGLIASAPAPDGTTTTTDVPVPAPTATTGPTPRFAGKTSDPWSCGSCMFQSADPGPQ